MPEARDGKAAPASIDGGALVPRFRNIDSKAKDLIRGYALNAHSSMRPMEYSQFRGVWRGVAKTKLDSYNSGFSPSMSRDAVDTSIYASGGRRLRSSFPELRSKSARLASMSSAPVS